MKLEDWLDMVIGVLAIVVATVIAYMRWRAS